MTEEASAQRCNACGSELAPALLSCPRCGRLVHAEELKRLAHDAEAATQAGQVVAALVAWRQALELLPPNTRQYQIISQKTAELSRRIDADPEAAKAAAEAEKKPSRSRLGVAAAGAGTVGLLLWKLKFVLGFLITKGKLLLVGLTKGSTFASMLLSLGVYWAAWGWKFALGLIVSIYIHEMGHVAALRRYGIKATAPMFLPGIGAVIRLKQYPTTPGEDARVGLAGPLWGLAAALGAYGVHLATGWESWAAIARVGAWINLFNLLPVWQLDGSRGFRALSRLQRWLAVATIAVMWFLTADGLLVLILIVAALRTLAGEPAKQADRMALVQFVFLIATLSALTMIEVAAVNG